jgi:hypothetical protein
MTISLKLGIGDADGSPVDLLDRTHFRVPRSLTTPGVSVYPKWTLGTDPATRILPVYCLGPTPSLNWQTIELKRIEAERGSGPWGMGSSNLVLYVEYPGETGVSFIDVYDIQFDPADLYQVGAVMAATATLTCSKYARGAPVTYGPFSVAGGGNAVWVSGAVPGDAPALARIKITDQSTGGTVLTRVRLGRHDHPLLVQGDLNPYFSPVPQAPGIPYAGDGTGRVAPALTVSAISAANPTHVTTTTPHNYVTGDDVAFGSTNSTPALTGPYIVTVIDATHFTVPVNVTIAGTAGGCFRLSYPRLTPVSSAWQPLCRALGPTSGKFNRRARILAKIRDSSAALGPALNTTVTPVSSGGTLTPGAWSYLPVPYATGPVLGPVGTSVVGIVPGVPAMAVNILDTDNFADLSKWSYLVIYTTFSGTPTFTVSGGVLTATGTALSGGVAQAWINRIAPDVLSTSKLWSVQFTIQSVSKGTGPGVLNSPVFQLTLSPTETYSICWNSSFSAWYLTSGVNNPLTALLALPDISTGTHTIEFIQDISHSSGVLAIYIDKALAAIQETTANSFPISVTLPLIVGESATETYKISAMTFADGLQAYALAGGAYENQIAYLAPTTGPTPAGYRIYIISPTGVIRYIDNGTALSYTHTSSSAGTIVSGLPGLAAVQPTQIRATVFAQATSPMEVAGPVVLPRRGGSVWEWVDLGGANLPPSPTRQGGTPVPWGIEIQAQNPSTDGSTKTLDCDTIVIFDELLERTELVATPAALDVWDLDTRYDGEVSCMLEDGSANILGEASVTAPFHLGPGGTYLVPILEVNDGNGNPIADAVNAAASISVTVTSRYAVSQGT